MVAAGGHHTLALKTDGTVWAWGWNENGQLGNNSNTNSNTPVQVFGLTNIVWISAGYAHSAALKSDGKIWTWGANSKEQLGDGTSVDKNYPIEYNSTDTFTKVACGREFCLALTSQAAVRAWGDGSSGQTGGAIVFSDGFERTSIGDQWEFSASGVGITSTKARSGGKSLRIAANGYVKKNIQGNQLPHKVGIYFLYSGAGDINISCGTNLELNNLHCYPGNVFFEIRDDKWHFIEFVFAYDKNELKLNSQVQPLSV